jgi:hypothetical protein
MHPNTSAGTGEGNGVGHFLGKGFTLAAQYPYLTAALSSMLVGKHWRWVKLAGIGIGLWRAYVGSNAHQP